MPRQRSIVMDKLDPQELRDHALRRSVERFEPYRIFSPKKQLKSKGAGWALIYVDPVTGERETVMDGLTQQTAGDFKLLLETAWARGRASSMTD